MIIVFLYKRMYCSVQNNAFFCTEQYILLYKGIKISLL